MPPALPDTAWVPVPCNCGCGGHCTADCPNRRDAVEDRSSDALRRPQRVSDISGVMEPYDLRREREDREGEWPTEYERWLAR